MAKNPVFPLYYNDIDRSTRDWTDEEFGCYMRLLMHQWDKFGIPKEPERLSRIVTSLDKNWLFLAKKFVETETGYINERLEEIRKECIKFSQKQSENGKKGGRPKKINPNEKPNINPKKSLHIEYENEIEDNISINGKSEKKSKMPLASDFNGLPEIKTGAVIKLLKITKQTDVTTEQVNGLWEVFKIQNLTGKKFYQDEDDVYSHFINWVKTQNVEKQEKLIISKEKQLRTLK